MLEDLPPRVLLVWLPVPEVLEFLEVAAAAKFKPDEGRHAFVAVGSFKRSMTAVMAAGDRSMTIAFARVRASL